MLRKLQEGWPEVNDLLSVTVIHLADERNASRSNEYYREAIKNMKRERYKKAQEQLYLALEMSRNNFDARVALEQANYELGVPSPVFDAKATLEQANYGTGVPSPVPVQP